MPDENEIKERGRAQAEMIRNYQRVFNSDVGQVVLRDLFRRFGFLTTTAAGDAYQTYFNEGQRAVITWLVTKQLKMNPDQILEQLNKIENS
jgi:hypothetical protein